MNKRARYICLMASVVLGIIILLAELYIRKSGRMNPLSSLENMFVTAGPVLIFGVVLVACHDRNNILHRQETPTSSTMIRGFSIREDQYEVGSESMVLLRVSNYSKRICDLKISAVYLDEDNNVLGRETQSVRGFARGFEKNLLFRPGYAFASFLYSIEDAPCEWENPEYSYQETVDKRQLQGKTLPQRLRLMATYQADQPICIKSCYLLMDDKENLLAVYQGEAVTFQNNREPVFVTATLLLNHIHDEQEYEEVQKNLIGIHTGEY